MIQEFICAGGCSRNSIDVNITALTYVSSHEDSLYHSHLRHSEPLDVDDFAHGSIVGGPWHLSYDEDADSGSNGHEVETTEEMVEGDEGDADDTPQCVGGPNDGMDYGRLYFAIIYHLLSVCVMLLSHATVDKYQRSCEYYPPWAIGFVAGTVQVLP